MAPPPVPKAIFARLANGISLAAMLLSVVICVFQSNVLFFVSFGLLGVAFLAVSVEFGGSRFAKATAEDAGNSLFLFGVAVIVFLFMTKTIQRVSDSDGRMPVRNSIMQIDWALKSHDEIFLRLPRHVIEDADGKALLSWRVSILPFIEQTPLYNQFKLNEPWDSPHNKPLLKGNAISVYGTFYPEPTDGTAWQVFIGPGTAFDPAEKILRLNHDFPDGTANTLLVVEAPTQVPWSKPEDLRYHPDEPLPKFGRMYHWQGSRPMCPPVSGKGFHAAMADGSVRFVNANVSDDVLRRVIVRNDGKPVADDWYR